MPAFSLMNAGQLTKPATVLIEKISNAVGTLWESRQIRRVAQAKADVAMILAKSDIEIDEVRYRAAQRFVEEETRKQLNMESIVEKAVQDVDANAQTEKVEDDWITNFFDKCRSVSDDEMQNLWARILSGEANSPGSFSRKTVNLVADLDKSSADLFQRLCSFGWRIDDTLFPLIIDFAEPIYIQNELNLFSLTQLDSIGLIQISATSGFKLSDLRKQVPAAYHNQSILLTFPVNKGNDLQMGKVIMTPSGRELSRIVKPTPIDGFFDYIYDKWVKESLVPPRQS